MTAYLDNSATTRPTEGVVAAMTDCMREGFYNPSSLYAPALAAQRRMDDARETLAQSLRCARQEIVFTSGGTEANHLAIVGTLQALHRPRHAVVSAAEHPSALSAFDAWRRAGCRVTVLPVGPDGQPDWDALGSALADPPDLVSCMQVNNETGAMPDIARLISMVKGAAPGCRIHVDGVQGFLRAPIDLRMVDFYSVSAHKIHGPKGVGALYVKRGVRISPLLTGGGQEGGLRSGTENTPGVAGLGRAVQEMAGIPDIGEKLMEKKLKLLSAFRDAVPDLAVNGPAPEGGAPHILNVSFPGVRGETLLHALEGCGVYCSTGAACSSRKRAVSPVLSAMGVPAERAERALRFSLSPHTADEEIELAARALAQVYPALSRHQRR